MYVGNMESRRGSNVGVIPGWTGKLAEWNGRIVVAWVPCRMCPRRCTGPLYIRGKEKTVHARAYGQRGVLRGPRTAVGESVLARDDTSRVVNFTMIWFSAG